jgi:transcriptional regulator with XRE-family HTH domain
MMNCMSAPTPWYRRLMALAELNGDRTQQDVAHTLGVSKAAVTSWKGGTRPDPEQVKAAARAYGADPLELMRIAYLDGDAEKPKPKRQPPRQGSNVPPL